MATDTTEKLKRLKNQNARLGQRYFFENRDTVCLKIEHDKKNNMPFLIFEGSPLKGYIRVFQPDLTDIFAQFWKFYVMQPLQDFKAIEDENEK